MLKIEEISSVASEIIEETAPEIDKSIQVTPKEYRARWRRIQEAMAEKGYILLYICGSDLTEAMQPG